MIIKNCFENILANLNEQKKKEFKNNPMHVVFQKDLKPEIERLVKEYDVSLLYKVNASIGNGNWADVPWLSILNTQITATTQSGIYPVYLFKADSSGIYLCLIQGSTALKENYKPKKNYIDESQRRKNLLLSKYPELKYWNTHSIDLQSKTDLGKSYEDTTIASKYYPAENIPSDEELKQDLYFLLEIYQRMKQDILQLDQISFTPKNNDLFPDETMNTIHISATRIPKPFLILAGISGTGKTRFVREQAKMSKQGESDNYLLVPVRPDWHEPSDLLGYSSRLSGKDEYIITPFLKFMVQAWQEIAKYQADLNAEFSLETLQQIRPFWLCLDEMNLAPVEQYFADYLAILETREWKTQGNNFVYACDAILHQDLFTQFEKLAYDLGLEKDSALYRYFSQNGIPLPFNLIVAGTVNMDETTHGFSRKVLDRALSFDFSEFYPNDFGDYFTQSTQNKALTYPIYSHAQHCVDQNQENIQKSITFLTAVNEVLGHTPFKLAYRALNELLLEVHSFNPENDETLQAVWDDFLMMKVLPRIEGDMDKLASKSDDEKSILAELSEILTAYLGEIWGEEKNRPDLWRETKENRIKCRTELKLGYMINKLERVGFTSFWQ
ncbi:MrcB family domain-containing protein [Lonepinella koalarum]|uniref:MrcB family domain-containing protein n=1 Tax=Lonepinella koalarum TaxID=53417 RepID=UPI003F6E0EC3